MNRNVVYRLFFFFAVMVCLAESADKPGEASEVIFDGESLAGWRVVPAGRAADWSVRDGLLVGKSNGKGSDILWKADDLSDFEMTLSYRFRTHGNSGIHIRGVTGASKTHRVKGYHADLGHVGIGPKVLGAWDFHGAPRGNVFVKRGQRVVVDKNGDKHLSNIEDALTPQDIRRSGWNDVRVVVRGYHLYFTINGKMASEVFDNEVAQRMGRGLIGLQLHSGRPMTVEFRNIRLRRLEPGEPQRPKQ